MTQLYLISPPTMEIDSFAKNLEAALKTTHIPLFQLRIKNINDDQITNFIKTLKPICHQYNTKFILNDNTSLAVKHNCDGLHLGENDRITPKQIQDLPKNFILGASCYDSQNLALNAAENNFTHASFGTFFPSNTKNSRGQPDINIINWCKKNTKLKTVAIGGINNQNYQTLIDAKVDYIAVISYIWNHPQGIIAAIEDLKLPINTST